MLIIKWVSQRGPWILLINTHKSLHHWWSVLLAIPEVILILENLNSGPIRLFLPPSHLGWMQSAQGMLHEGDDFALSSWVRQDRYPFSFSFFDLEGKDRIQWQDVLFMVQILGEYLIFWFMEKLRHFSSAKDLVCGVLWHHHCQKSVTVLFLSTFLVRFSVSRHCDTYVKWK